MKLISKITILAAAIVTSGCSGKNDRENIEESGLLRIDVKALMDLPVEEFDALSNAAIASIEYFQPHDSLVYPWGMAVVGDTMMAIDNDVITVLNRSTGRLEASFTRKGNGPEEYAYVLGVAPDFKNREVYVLTPDNPSRIKRYSFDGAYIDETVLDDKIHPTPYSFRIHTDSCLFVEQSPFRKVSWGLNDDPLVDTPYLLINFFTGRVTPLPIGRPDARICRHYVPKTPDPYSSNDRIPISGFAGGEGWKLISEYSNDTIYRVCAEKAEPLAVKTNWSRSVDSPDLVAMQYVNDRYMVFEIMRKTTDHSNENVSIDEEKSGTFIYDRKNKRFHRYADPVLFYESGGHLYKPGSIEKLTNRAEAGEIKDKNLLDIVARSNEESNWIYTIYTINE